MLWIVTAKGQVYVPLSAMLIWNSIHYPSIHLLFSPLDLHCEATSLPGERLSKLRGCGGV